VLFRQTLDNFSLWLKNLLEHRYISS